MTRNLNVWTVCLAILFVTMLSPVVSAQQAAQAVSAAQVRIGRLEVQEGSDFFTVEVECYLKTSHRRPQRTACQIETVDATDYIRIDPQVEFQVVAGSGRFRLIGAFKPRSTYVITFLPGLRTAEGALLPLRVQKDVTTPGFKPVLRFLGRARYLPPLQGASLPFEARNANRLRVSYRQVFPQNLIFWLTKNQETVADDVADEVHHVELRLPGKLDEETTGQIDLDVLHRFGQGVFEVAVDLLQDDASTRRLDSATVVITDLAAVAKQDGDDLYVWTRSAATMRARADVRVRVMTYSNREIASCTTSGPEAACTLKQVMRQHHKPFALLLSAGSDLSYLRFSDVEIMPDRAGSGLRPYTEADAILDAYVYASRGVYRPGETVNLGAVVWTVSRQAAGGIPLQWQILTPRNKVMKEVSMRASPFGMAGLDVKLDDFALTGRYQAILKSGDKRLQTYGFFVETFVPERIGMTVTATEDLLIDVPAAAFDVEAKYLFGPPVASGSYTVRCTLLPAWFSVPGHADFSTGVYSQQPPPARVLEPVLGELDANGRATAECDYERFMRAFPTVMRLKADVEVAESGSGRVTLKSASALIAATPEIVGLRALRVSNNQIQVEGRLFSPAGDEIRREVQVEVSLYRVEVNWNYVWDPERGVYSWKREEILLPEGGGRMIEVKQGRFETTLSTRQRYGGFLVRARLAGSQAVADLKVSLGYAWFWDVPAESGAPRAPSPERINLLLSSSEVEAGTPVTVRFEAPFDGHLLLAMESDRLLESRWIEIRKGPQEFEFTAPPVLPNVYLSALLLKHPMEETFYVPGRAWGSAALKIVPRVHTMSIAVEAPDEMRPQRDLEITLRAQPGEKTQFTVAVVDEGILQLTDFKTPDPLGYFFQPRQLGVRSFETVGWTFARALDTVREPGGGTAGSDRKPAVIPVTIVSHWSGVVDSDAQGVAVVRAPIPQFQGTLRVMVVGASNNRVGSAEHRVTVRDPLVLQATMPRFLLQDDTFSIPVFVANVTGAIQEVTVDVQSNAAVELPQTRATATVPHMQSHLFRFPARVRGFAGTASVVVTASGGGHSTRETVRVPVVPFTPEKSVAVTVHAGEAITLADLIPPELRTEELRLEVAVSTMPFLQELGRLRGLLHYPYGCIEQTTSGTFPLLYISGLLEWVDPALAAEHDLTDMVYAGINRLITMQTTSGGFGYWPGHNEPTLWGSAYVTHLFLKARELGYDVPASALADALDFLQEAISTRRYAYDRKYGRDLVQSEPYMLYVLGLAGRHQQARLRQLAAKPPKWGNLETENEFLLMLTYYLAGDRRVYEQYKARRHGLRPVTLGGRQHRGTFWSGLRTDAMRLSLAEDVWPGDAVFGTLTQRVASALQTRRYLSTQEMSWSVSALGKRVQPYRGVDIAKAGLQLNGLPIEPTARYKDVPVWSLSGYPFAGQTLNVTYTSDKPPLIYIKMHGYVRDFAALQTPEVPFRLWRRYLDLRGEPLAPGTLKQGDLAVVELSIGSLAPEEIPNIAVVDRLPAGFEVENPRLGRQRELDWIPQDGLFEPDYVNLRDDRLQLFGTLQMRGHKREETTRRFYYVVRAVTPGVFAAPPAWLELMYDPEQVFYTRYDRVTIE